VYAFKELWYCKENAFLKNHKKQSKNMGEAFGARIRFPFSSSA